MNDKEKIGIGIVIAAALLLRGGGQPPVPAGPIVKKPGDTVVANISFEFQGNSLSQVPIGFYLLPGNYRAMISEVLVADNWQSFQRTVILTLPGTIPAGLYNVRVFAGPDLYRDYPDIYKVEA